MNIESLIGLVMGAAFAVGLALYMNGHRAEGHTGDGVTGIKFEIADIKSDLKLMKWMLVAIVVGTAYLVAKAFG